MSRVAKAMTQPLTVIFRFLQNKARIQIWLFEQPNLRIEGKIIGFDEFMNVVLDDAEEIYVKTKVRKPIGRILLKGENITLIQSASPAGTGAAGTGAASSSSSSNSSGAGGAGAAGEMAEDR